MPTPIDLTPAQETQAQELATRLQSKAAETVLAMARTLVATGEADLFGPTEFKLRDQALGLLATAYTEHLREKKTATAARRSTARTAASRPASTTTAPATPNPSAE